MDHPATSAPAPRENRLAREKSPYLLQHRFNPVDWFPWGPEALARARAEDRPIFLSIGYSTCHWCHVMERESFEDPGIAELLNRSFIPIKVDREERPDLDKIYLTYVQARTGAGGWPLNVFLTPDLDPFYGGTYWPVTGKHGRPGLGDILEQLSRIWRDRRGEVVAAASEMTARLREFAAQGVTEAPPGEDEKSDAAVLDAARAALKEDYDPRHGGFGGAPKFPRPSHPAFLLAEGVRTGDREAVEMVLHTCRRMAAGGLQDQLGGGFARYSVDARWLVPHFEKMLYDNAQLLHLYLDALLVSGEEGFAATARATVQYVLRDLTHPEGGFFSAEDADSEGHEGKFYCWTAAELESLLPPDEWAVVQRHYGITRPGNFQDHSHPQPLAGQNVLSVVEPVAAADRSTLEAARSRMLEARSRRVRPHRDDKVLASWNGLMLGALARAAILLDEPAWADAARRNLAFLRDRLWEPGSPGVMHHRWRDGERDAVQLLDDHAFVLEGALHLYETTLDAAVLEFCVALAEAMIARFHDPDRGGFWQSGGGDDLIVRVKEDYDGAEPSGNSVAAVALLRLAEITGREAFREAAWGTLNLYRDRLTHLPLAVPVLLRAFAFDRLEAARQRVVVAGDPADAATRALLRVVHRTFGPHRVVLGTGGPVDPWAAALPARSGRPTAYVCTGQSCQAPVGEPEALAALLR